MKKHDASHFNEKPTIESFVVEKEGKYHAAIRSVKKIRAYDIIFEDGATFEREEEARAWADGWKKESDESGYVTGNYHIYASFPELEKKHEK